MQRAILVATLLLLDCVVIKSQCIGTGCPGTSSSSVTSSVIDLQAATAAINMTGSAVTIYSTANVSLAAGQCLVFNFGNTATGAAAGGATIQIFADATLIYTAFTGGTMAQISYTKYCNTTGSLTVQLRYDPVPLNYGNAGAFGSNYTISSDGASSTPTSVNWTSTHTITLKATAASGTVTGAWWNIIKQQ